jgi:fatty-acyl-CoA synthase
VKAFEKAKTSLPLVRANMAIIERPDRVTRAVLAARPYGTGLLAAVAASVGRYPNAPAVICGAEEVSYRQLWRGSTALATKMTQMDLTSDSRVAILCRNSEWFVYSLVAAAQLGADIVLLNTSFGPGQLKDTLVSERVDVVLHDEEFADAVGTGAPSLSVAQLRAIVTESGHPRLPRPLRHSRLVVLTSGTTGRPKGASRQSDGAATEGAAALLGKVPLRVRDTLVVPAPFFHAWGLAGLLIALGLSGTVVTSPEFDPAGTLELVDTHRADALLVVPTMLQRICALPPPELARFETSSLRIIAASGSAIPGPLVTEVLNRFGPVLHNIYGSTEVATATVARPRDLRVAPTTAGRPATGVRVAILDATGRPVETGTTGRVFVANAARFDGYTGGGGKEVVDGLLSTGDLGHFDHRGLLFVDGREDDMIVSGGENVYPAEVEHVLNQHPDIEEAVVVGVDDEKFGRALKAVVVQTPGRSTSPEDLKAYVTERLARYKVPRTFVYVDQLPRTATGKVLKRELV